jgi:hypothetical protein
MPNLNIGLPSIWFHDDEMLGSRVRLLSDQDVGFGQRLMRGECFVVAGIRPGSPRDRVFLLTNGRAKQIPVSGACCELILSWPARREGQGHGR